MQGRVNKFSKPNKCLDILPPWLEKKEINLEKCNEFKKNVEGQIIEKVCVGLLLHKKDLTHLGFFSLNHYYFVFDLNP